MENQIVIGKIVAPHGVRGDIRILPLTDKPEQFLDLDYLLLPDGRKLTVTGVVNRSVDDALVPAALEALKTHMGVAPTGLFRTTYEVGTKVFKTLDQNTKNLLANVITEKQGAPQLKVTEAK